jgi:putative FmdB family regulatory protein
MPLYEYHCKTCDTSFEERRPVAEASSGLLCPGGHSDVVKLISVFAATGRAASSPMTACGSPVPGSCGGGCACHS